MSRAAGPGAARRLALFVTLAASMACLAAGFAEAGIPVAACIVPLPGLLLLLRKRVRRAWAASAFLAAMVLAAAVEAVVNAPALLVVPGAALALAAWDLAEFDRFLGGNDSTAAAPSVFRRHVLSLARGIGLGLLFAAGGYAVSLSIPFPLMFFLVILDLACLGYVLSLARK
jgi:hypothetical protein